MAASDPSFLLQDLLSPPSEALPPRSLAQQLVLQLSTVPLDPPHLAFISLLTRYAASSDALWRSDALSRWDKCLLAYEALRQSVALRLEAIARPATSTRQSDQLAENSGWTARKTVRTFLDEVNVGLWTDPAPSPSSRSGDGFGTVDPLIRVAFASGILAALQAWKRRKERLWVGGSHALPRARREVGRAWRELLDREPAESDTLPAAWIAAQTLPSIGVEIVAEHWPTARLLPLLSRAFSRAFADGHALTQPPLSADLVETADGLRWTKGSPSHIALTELVASPTFTNLGSLSRAVGRALEACAAGAQRSDSQSVPAIHDLSTTMLAITTRVAEGWESTPWADVEEDSRLAPETREETAPWTLLKTLLFAQTLVYSSFLDILSTSQTSENESHPVQRALAAEAVRALGKTYFVALKFGQAGFPAWRMVLAGLVDVIERDGVPSWNSGSSAVSAAEQLARSLERRRGDLADGRHSRVVERAEVTFWMNTLEQVAPRLSNEYIEEHVLPKSRPYLESAEYRDAFEAAHSVVLALFAAGKECTTAVAPWYFTLVLRTYPSLLSVTQFRLACSTTVAAVSQADDALAMWCLEELLERTEQLPIAVEEPRRMSDVLPGEATLQADPASAGTEVTPLDTRALTLPRGGHLLALAALLPTVNLRVLPTLLQELERLIRLEPVGSDGRAAVVEAVFDQIGVGMDAVKRGVATEWWVRHGADLRRAGPVDEAAAAVVGRDDGRSSGTYAAEKGRSPDSIGEGTHARL